MSVRIDKWLHVARVYKTRTQATHACDLSRVRVNGVAVKPHRALAVGDRVEAEVTPEWTRVLVVHELADRTLPKAEVPRLFEDLSPPRPTRDSLEHLLTRPIVRRDAGAGRPTKKERREIDSWWDGQVDD
ncbi:MAG: RNA-binding S4 domain-containing protein [Holophagales bacterium]|nr:MAG: RNA-binding S4 domain-containing protein [Holophagales bacterium]